MPIFTITMAQNAGETYDVTLNPPTQFAGTELLSATISTGGTAAPIATITPVWKAGQVPGSFRVVRLPISATVAAMLPPTYYVVSIQLADSSAELAWGLLEVVSGAGNLPLQDFLVTPAEVLGLVPDLTTVDRIADLPRVITSATQSIRRYCSRNFTRQTVTKEFTPNPKGQVRLDEIPVNEVLRIATGRDAALWIVGPSSAQIANVRYSYTGDYDSGITVTGLVLVSTTNAVSTSTTFLFATYPTIGSLAAAINTAGWSTRINSLYGQWPTSELVGGDSAQGALQGSGCQLDVYGKDASMERLDPATGMLWLGYGAGFNSSLDSPAWGPDWIQFLPVQRAPIRCRITYDAGFTTIPSPVVMAAIETIQASFSRLATDQILKSEKADAYEYQLRDQLDFLPDSAKHALAPYRLFNA